jgi:hypothetical protein
MSRLAITPQQLLNEVGFVPLSSLDLYPGDTVSAALRAQATDYETSDPAGAAAYLVFADAAGAVIDEFLIGSVMAADGQARLTRGQIEIPAGSDGVRFEVAPIGGHVETLSAWNLQINKALEVYEFTVPSITGPTGRQGPQGEPGQGDRFVFIFRAAATPPATPTSDAYPPAGWSLSIPAATGDQEVYLSGRWQAPDGSWASDAWEAPGNIRGPAGPEGPQGTGLQIDGVVADVGSLPVASRIGEAYLIGTDIHVWDGVAYVVVGGALGPEGPAGPPGLTWEGAWDIGTAYPERGVVQYLGTAYVALEANTGNPPDTSPAQWAVLAQKGEKGDQGDQGETGPPADLGGGRTTRGATWVSGGAPITSANAVICPVPADTEVRAVTIATIGGPGNLVMDVRLVDRGAGIGTGADSICGGAKPTIVADTAYYSADMSAWTTFIDAGKDLVFVLDSVDTFTAIFANLELVAFVADGEIPLVHATLLGKDADDHPQYLNNARGDARYAPIAHGHGGVYSPVGHGHTFDALTGVNPVTKGGTGKSSMGDGNFLRGGPGDTIVERTPAQVLADIGAAASSSVNIDGKGISSGPYTVLAVDKNKLLYPSGATPPTVFTLPPNATEAIAQNTWVHVMNPNAADLTIQRGSGVALFLYNGSAPVNDDIVLAQGGMISLQKSATNQWIAVGVGASQP